MMTTSTQAYRTMIEEFFGDAVDAVGGAAVGPATGPALAPVLATCPRCGTCATCGGPKLPECEDGSVAAGEVWTACPRKLAAEDAECRRRAEYAAQVQAAVRAAVAKTA